LYIADKDLTHLHDKVENIERDVESIKQSIKSLEISVTMRSPNFGYPIWPTIPAQQCTSPFPAAGIIPPSFPAASGNLPGPVSPHQLTGSSPGSMPATPIVKPSPSIDPNIPVHHKPPLPIPPSENALPSSAIEDWPRKKSIEEVIDDNHKLAKTSKVSTLAVKIAVDAVFGASLMKKCTALGGRDLPGLPRTELFKIKKAIYDLFPAYWKNLTEYETVWSSCIDAIGQKCKRLRSSTA